MAAQRQNEEARRPDAGEETTGRGGEEAGKARRAADDIRQTLRGELTDVIRDAAIEVLTPVARKATTSAAKYAVTKGP